MKRSRKEAYLVFAVLFFIFILFVIAAIAFRNMLIFIPAFVVGIIAIIFIIMHNRCPYCGGYLDRMPFEGYCPHCDKFLTGNEKKD